MHNGALYFMLVKELIDLLLECPMDQDVIICVDECDELQIKDVDYNSIVTNIYIK